MKNLSPVVELFLASLSAETKLHCRGPAMWFSGLSAMSPKRFAVGRYLHSLTLCLNNLPHEFVFSQSH